ncbi:MAG: hypothetical protein NWE93_12170 [Candidatus Bathyarchaeota archaeon]|nr:hypothetical protein [Candidatus Bathyarchaeota archaeon]
MLTVAGLFIGAGAFLLAASIFLDQQVAAFIGLGLTFWGAVLALARSGRYVESSLLDSTARSSYSTIDRMVKDLKFSGQAYYIPAYPKDVFIPEYLANLKDPVVFISESFDGKPAIEELAAGKFISAKSPGVFIVSPGSGLISQVEKQLQLDLSKINLGELCEVLPKYLTENLNLARTAELTLTSEGAGFKASGIIFESLYSVEGKPASASMLGCPLVSAVASALAKTSGKTVVIKELSMAANSSVNVVYGLL